MQIDLAWCKGVSFRYRENLPLVLRKLHLELTPGQRVGVVGRTGSGKSTLLRQFESVEWSHQLLRRFGAQNVVHNLKGQSCM